MKRDDFVKVYGVDGEYRYGYIGDIKDYGNIFIISLYDEGESKLAYDAAQSKLTGEGPPDYVSDLTDIEKKLIPLLAAGYETREIAVAMDIQQSTVRAHLRTLRIKLHLDDRAQLVTLAPAVLSMIREQDGVEEEIEKWKKQKNGENT